MIGGFGAIGDCLPAHIINPTLSQLHARDACRSSAKTRQPRTSTRLRPNRRGDAGISRPRWSTYPPVTLHRLRIAARDASTVPWHESQRVTTGTARLSVTDTKVPMFRGDGVGRADGDVG